VWTATGTSVSQVRTELIFRRCWNLITAGCRAGRSPDVGRLKPSHANPLGGISSLQLKVPLLRLLSTVRPSRHVPEPGLNPRPHSARGDIGRHLAEAGAKLALLQFGQGAPAPLHSHAYGPCQGRSGWFSQTHPQSSHRKHIAKEATASVGEGTV